MSICTAALGATTGQLASVKYYCNSRPKCWPDVLTMHDNILEAADCPT